VLQIGTADQVRKYHQEGQKQPQRAEHPRTRAETGSFWHSGRYILLKSNADNRIDRTNY
jgi:hypothetical protein